MTKDLSCVADGSAHPSEAHKAGCPVCNPTKTVPELNQAYAALTSKQRCAVIDCENKRGDGQFVGDFCAPCDTALRTGNFDHGTSIPFKLSAEVSRQRQQIERLQNDRNECLEAFHILFRIFPEPK